jgi:hypothetical protein
MPICPRRPIPLGRVTFRDRRAAPRGEQALDRHHARFARPSSVSMGGRLTVTVRVELRGGLGRQPTLGVSSLDLGCQLSRFPCWLAAPFLRTGMVTPTRNPTAEDLMLAYAEREDWAVWCALAELRPELQPDYPVSWKTLLKWRRAVNKRAREIYLRVN